MRKYEKSIIPVIEYNYQNLTSIERTIADFFIQNKEKTDLSAKAVAEKIFVSEASLSRFAKKCGYRGYREFIYQYEATFQEGIRETVNENRRKVLDAYQEILNKAYNLVDDQKFRKVSRMMTKADRIFVCGVGSSGIVARETELRFMRIGININSLVDRDMIRMRTVFQDETSLVMGLSMKGETREVQYFLRESHKRKAKCILVTARNNPEFREYCDEIIYVPALKNLDWGELISPQFPMLVMMDILYTYCLEQNKDKTERFLEDTAKALHEQEETGLDNDEEIR
nr:MurR/RpiR family transcriptional regulator [uncultured Sellimonas sp.]